MTPTANPGLFAAYEYYNEAAVDSNNVGYGFGEATAAAYPLYTNFSAFIQDEWHALPRLNASFGLRWDVNPAPGVTAGLMPYTVTGLDDLSTVSQTPAEPI